jgi:hypothetical protein
LVLGYSVKSLGIAKDLGFGDFVLNCKNINSNTDLLNKFKELGV